ncbi:MAG: phenylacetate--CoA ligase [Dehalococcoidales bacterium]|nr:phenylacetate--CoA ligase [Dehalococcoidales bacterium]
MSDIAMSPVSTEEELARLQLERLKWSVAHAYNNVEFYRQKMDAVGVTPDDIRTLDDIVKLPMTDKYELRQTYPFGLRAVPFKDIVRIHASSGTTGKRTVAYYSQKDIDDWKDMFARCYKLAGLTEEDRFQVAVGYGLWTAGAGFQLGAERFGMMTIPTGPGNTDMQIEMMLDFGTTAIICTSSYALFLAEEIAARGVGGKLSLRTLILGSERSSDQLRARIAELLDVEVFDIIGMTELYGPGIGIDCLAHQGIHYFADHFIFEIIDPLTGKPVPMGEQGEIVATTLTREAMPMIRYRTRDLSRLIPGRCSCGVIHPRQDRIVGRTDDMIKFHAVNIFPGQIDVVLSNAPGVGTEYQVVLRRERGRDSMILRVERCADTSLTNEEIESAVRDLMKSRIGVTPVVEIVPYQELPRSERKTKRIFDEREA